MDFVFAGIVNILLFEMMMLHRHFLFLLKKTPDRTQFALFTHNKSN